MSLATPDKISSLQRKLYGKAKAEPAYRFYRLYDKILRPDILEYAYALARENDGASGVDGVTFETIEAMGPEGWLAALREALASKTYRPTPVRRVMIPKPGGGERPLGIPHHPGPGGPDRRQAGAGTHLRGGLGRLRLWIQAQTKRARRRQDHAPADPPGLCRCRRRRSVQILRHHPASRAHAERGSSNLRPSRAASDQAVAACSGRRTGRQGKAEP